MKPAFCVLALLIIVSCKQAQKPNVTSRPMVMMCVNPSDTDSRKIPVKPFDADSASMANAVLTAANKVWEIKEFMRDAKKEKSELVITDEPKPGFNYYWLQLGISNFDMFRSTENYCVDPKTLEVFYWDVMADDLGFSNSAVIPLSYWRQIRNTPGYQKRHTYKHGKLVVLPELQQHGKKTTT